MSRLPDNDVAGAEKGSTMTTMLRLLAQLFATAQPLPAEFRAERVDQVWDQGMTSLR